MDVGAPAEFAASTEWTFGTIVQRVMAMPGGVRFHYGHPDVWNKLFVMTRGGVSKATRWITSPHFVSPSMTSHGCCVLQTHPLQAYGIAYVDPMNAADLLNSGISNFRCMGSIRRQEIDIWRSAGEIFTQAAHLVFL